MKIRLLTITLALILTITCIPVVNAADNVTCTIANAGDRFFAVGTDGKLYAWGNNNDGLLVDTPDGGGTILTPIAIMDGVIAVESKINEIIVTKLTGDTIILCESHAAEDNRYALNGNTLYDADGEVIAKNIVTIATNASGINLALDADGQLLAWGNNSTFLLGAVTYMFDVIEPLVMMKNVLLPGKTATPKQPLPPAVIPSSSPTSTPTKEPPIERPRYLDTLALPEVTGHPSFWAIDEANAAAEAGILPEQFATDFQNDITRLEFCMLLDRTIRAVTDKPLLCDESKLKSDIEFVDTPYAEPHNMAALGIVEGIGDNLFDPSSPITREDAATMLRRAAGVLGLCLTSSQYTTNEYIDVWAQEGVNYVTSVGIMKGKADGFFDPLANYTREESLLTLIRLYNLAN